MLHAFVTFAATEEEGSKLAFYLLGGLLALFAVAVSALGVKRHDFPATRGALRAVIGLAVLLVAAAMASAVLTS